MNYNQLSNEQQEMICKVLEGNNVLVDACIGSGKTTAIQVLCDVYSGSVLYLTYNHLLKLDAKEKIRSKMATVTNYHGFASMALREAGVSSVGISDLIQQFNKTRPLLKRKYTLLVLDEYQDIEQEIAEMLLIIKEQNPDIQIVAVGDMQQKIYDKTTLDVSSFINSFLEDFVSVRFTKCFRLSEGIASFLGRVWQKEIVGVNRNCVVEKMSLKNVERFLAEQDPGDILCLGSRQGPISAVLNRLEENYPEKYNKDTVYASIKDNDRGVINPDKSTAIFTTFDASKGLERKICIVFDFTEEYWHVRTKQAMADYIIMRNIFCVAASRGKEKIIFVKGDGHMLSEGTLSTPTNYRKSFKESFFMSDMFSFKYKEDVEACYHMLDIKRIPVADTTVIETKNSEGLIDLSPCVGSYQEAAFFKNYDIDSQINFAKKMHRDRYYSVLKKNATLDEKLLYLTMVETNHDRYVTQVDTPFVTREQSRAIKRRLGSIFDREDTVQVPCTIGFRNTVTKENCFIEGRTDVLKNKKVYELKFVSELTHEHFLQCACYVVALGLKKGILWNVRTNEMYKIKVPNRRKFMNQVVRTITKGVVTEFHAVC